MNLYGTYRNRKDPKCICEFQMLGIMTGNPTEHTIHNPECPIHKLEITDICKCEKIWYKGKDCFENIVEYVKTNTHTCTMHNNEQPYVRLDKGSFYNGWDKRKNG